jgi:AcrR family transcriptional regulator
MMEKIRLKAPERRRHILDTATVLFAERGFDGLTTKDLARRLGITEPVLYQHFASKEALWREVQRLNRFPFAEWELHARAAAPSTRQFVLITGMLVWGMTLGRRPGAMEALPGHGQLLRLLGHGLFEIEGPLCGHQEHFSHTIFPWWMLSFQAAYAGGDLDSPLVSDEPLWLAFRQMLALGLMEAGRPHLTVSWDSEGERYVHLTRTLLRGLGVRDDVIRRELSFAKTYQFFHRHC